MKIVSDFFNKVAKEIDATFFKEVVFYRDNEDCAKAHYALELFNNGAMTYSALMKKLAKLCKTSTKNIHEIVSKHIEDFEGYVYVV